nr:AbrB family transcriptional regulator [Halomonas socia]
MIQRSASRFGGLLRCLLAGALGGVVFEALGLPLAWLVGPIIGNLLLSRGGSIWLPDPLRTLGLGIMGLMMGSLVSPDLVDHLMDWRLSVLILIAGVIVSTLLVVCWYRHCGFDTPSAWLSAIPGGMAAMVMVVEQAGGNLQRVAVSQALRVVVVVCVLPPLFVLYGGQGGDGASVVSEERGFDSLWMVLVIPLLVPLGKRLGIVAAPMLMPLLFSASFSVFELASFAIPAWAMNLALLFLGCSIGAKFGAFSMEAIAANARITLVATLLAIAVFALFAELIHQATGISRAVALLALAPGGMAEMSALAVVLGLDPLYVAFHQLLRVIGLMALAPLLAKRLGVRGRHAP